MNRVRRTTARLAALALAAAAAASTTVAPAAVGDDTRTGQTSTERTSIGGPFPYVALGDSYSAASGVLPPDPEAPPQCARSILNYPHRVADFLGAELTDVTCGAAETKDFFEPQHDGVPPQLDALTRRTALVTMTIGGNDQGVFIGAIAKCGVAGVSTAGQGSPCKDQYGDSMVKTVRTKTYPALVKALTAVKRKAPRAQVLILGYPWIVPAEGSCFDKLPIAEGDVPYLRHLQWVLNNAVRRAAAETGATYVNMNRRSEGHDACQPIGVRWVEPVLQSTNPVVVHPNALGERKMARAVLDKIGM